MTWWPWLHPNLRAEPNRARAVPLRNALFVRAAPLRRMIVVVDADLRERAHPGNLVWYLLDNLVSDESIESHLYADEAEPGEGWLSVQPADQEQSLYVLF